MLINRRQGKVFPNDILQMPSILVQSAKTLMHIDVGTTDIYSCYSISGRLRRAPNVLFMVRKYA